VGERDSEDGRLWRRTKGEYVEGEEERREGGIRHRVQQRRFVERASKVLEHAAALRWQAKHSKYWGAVNESEAVVAAPERRRVPGVVPIVFETTGRLYSGSREWAERVLFKNEKSKLSSLLSACSCLLARGVGEALHEGALRGMGSAR
jgi:hypothetical protein